MAQVIDAGQHRPKHLRLFDHAADRDAAEADAVIALFAADQAGALALAAGAVIGQRDLERGIHRLGAGIGEEHVVEWLRRNRGQAFGQHEGQRMAHLEGRREIQRGDLLADRLHDARCAHGRHCSTTGRRCRPGSRGRRCVR